MPVVAIRTGDGGEEILREYLCDYPDCPNTACHVMGHARELGGAYAVCDQHAGKGHTTSD